MKLYYFPPSPNAIKVLAVVRHLGLDIEEQIVDLTKGDQKTPEFLALNPNGKMPVLEDGDFALWESNAIMQYLAGNAKSDLYPEDLKTQVDINRWLFWQGAHWGSAIGTIFYEKLVKGVFEPGSQPDPAQIAKGEAFFKQHAAVLDGHLANRTYILGDQLTLADLAVASPAPYRNFAGLPLEGFDNLNAWFERIEALDCWSEAVPDLSEFFAHLSK